MYEFLNGATMMASWTAALLFVRCWRRTHDRLFIFFATAFGLFGLERWVVAFQSTPNEAGPWIYVLRLLAFLVILAGILDKNHPARRAGGR